MLESDNIITKAHLSYEMTRIELINYYYVLCRAVSCGVVWLCRVVCRVVWWSSQTWRCQSHFANSASGDVGQFSPSMPLSLHASHEPFDK